MLYPSNSYQEAAAAGADDGQGFYICWRISRRVIQESQLALNSPNVRQKICSGGVYPRLTLEDFQRVANEVNQTVAVMIPLALNLSTVEYKKAAESWNVFLVMREESWTPEFQRGIQEVAMATKNALSNIAGIIVERDVCAPMLLVRRFQNESAALTYAKTMGNRLKPLELKLDSCSITLEAVDEDGVVVRAPLMEADLSDVPKENRQARRPHKFLQMCEFYLSNLRGRGESARSLKKIRNAYDKWEKGLQQRIETLLNLYAQRVNPPVSNFPSLESQVMKEDVIDLEIPLSSDEDEEMGELVQTGDDDGILPPNSMQFDVESDEMSAQDTLEDKPLAERDKYMELTKKILDDLESSGIENRLNFNQYRRAPPQEKRESSKNNSRSFGMNRRPDGQVSDIARGAFRLRRNFNVNFSPSKESAQQRTKSNKSADGSSKQATGPTTQILLVRHGQSTWNAEGRWQGQADMSLSSLGVAQSVQAALRLSGGPQVLAEGGGIPDIGAIYSSNMKRAKQTAQILSSQAGLGKIMEDERFRERSVGEWSGLTYEEVQQKWPGYLKRRLLPPSYETDDMVLPRVFSALDYVRMQHPGQRVVVVCHAGVIYAVEAYLKAKSGYRNPQRRYRIGNLGSRWVIWDGSGFRLGRRVNLIADGGVSSALPELYQE